MLKASILDRFCPEVLDAIRGPAEPSEPSGREQLEVNGRRRAVDRAVEKGILGRPSGGSSAS